MAKCKQLEAQAKKAEKAAKQLLIQQAKQQRQQQAAEPKEVAKSEQRRKEVAKEISMASRQLQQTLLASAIKPKKRSKFVVLHLPTHLLLDIDDQQDSDEAELHTPAPRARRPPKRT
ncbi:hypothetical protein LTR49_027270 [Elasticomyces elasticus]|nr:hypothetical protein LTR49_027270 [Elasticomyces elasticus]